MFKIWEILDNEGLKYTKDSYQLKLVGTLKNVIEYGNCKLVPQELKVANTIGRQSRSSIKKRS